MSAPDRVKWRGIVNIFIKISVFIKRGISWQAENIDYLH